MSSRRFASLGTAIVLLSTKAYPQAVPREGMTLPEAIALASTSFGEARASRSELSASTESLNLAKRSYLPEANLYFQWNRASRNNTFGLVFPSAGLPGISGPALEDETSQGTFGSVAALLVRWEAFDFGARSAAVDEAAALKRRAEAGLRATEIEVSLGAADTFLGLVAAESAVEAAAAAVARMEIFASAVSARVENELRPGADLSLARAELARTKSELVRTEGIREQTRVSLAEWLGRTGERVDVNGSRLLESTPPAEVPPPQEVQNPLAEVGRAERDAAQARREIARRSFHPRIDLLASFYGRGTGALLDGSFEGGSAGLWPERTNWALGLALRFPLLDFLARQETNVAEYREEAANARWEKTLERVEADLERARIHLDAARRIVENTPAELEAARALQVQARGRYDAGLAEVLEVAEAERTLRRAETEDVLARLDVWRARFEVAAAEGDLAPVISELEDR